MYNEKFLQAIERTCRFGLPDPKFIKLSAERFLDSETQEKLPYIIRDKLGILEEDEIVLQCLLLNMRLKEVFLEYFKVPVYYTIGYIGIDEKFMFQQTEESLEAMLKNGIEGPSISLHAWLTLPSMEILDFSISTSYGKVNGIKKMMGAALALHPSELTGGMSYHPMIIGEDFLHRIGAMRLYVDIGI